MRKRVSSIKLRLYCQNGIGLGQISPDFPSHETVNSVADIGILLLN